MVEAVYKHPQVPVYDEPRGLKIDADEVLYSYPWVSRDEGASWIETPFFGSYQYSVIAASPYSSVIYGFAGGLRHVSHDSGLTWSSLQDSLSVLGVDEAIDPRDSTLYVARGNVNGGIYAYARVGTVGTPVERPTAPWVLTARAYPNPFRDEVTVEVEAPAGEAVTVEIFDVLGRRVATLAEGARATTRFTWDGRSENGQALAAGIYFVRVRQKGSLAGSTYLALTLLD